MKWVRGLMILLAVRMRRSYCGSQFDDTGLCCERRPHRRGDHRAAWAAWTTPPASVPPFDAEANPGYAAFLASKYGPSDYSA